MAEWYVNTGQGNKGPFDQAKMSELVAQGHVSAQSWVWREGMENWTQLGQTPEFSGAQPAAPPPQAAPSPAAAGGALDAGYDDRMDAIFGRLIEKSWARHRAREQASELDEVLVGGVITGVLDNGYKLIDLTSDGANHYLRFEMLDDGSRVIFQLQHRAESLMVSKVIGQEAAVTIGYGERVKNMSKIMGAIKQEMKGGYITQAEPGIISIDADISSQYVYVQVGMIWDIADYLDPSDPYKVLYPKLSEDLGGTLHALKKYLRGRFGA
jgi:hypothetical protein